MTRARRLTPEGTRRAKAYLASLRTNLLSSSETPDDLLFDSTFAVEFNGAPDVAHREFGTRRDAATYIETFDPPISLEQIDDWAFWSWLGLYHMHDILGPRQAKTRSVDEWIIVDGNEGRSRSMGARHYFWSAWRLNDVYGDDVAYLLDRDITEHGRLSTFILDTQRTFNSVGIVALAMALYTHGKSGKSGTSSGPGSIAHLRRVLDQRELSHDVYGMSAEALMEILPAEFDRWKS